MQAPDDHAENDESEQLSSPHNFPRRSSLITLNIALYPWASSDHLDQYCRVIEEYWYNTLDNRHVRLNWLTKEEWDGGYRSRPRDDFDVYIYDTLYTNYFASQGWLCTLDRNEIVHADEINPNILSLVEADQGRYYGIPIYGCFYLLFYRADDKELASIKTFDDLVQVASKRHFIMRRPDRETKMSSYLTLVGSNYPAAQFTEENINADAIHHLSRFYQHSKLFLNQSDRYAFKQSSFYVGFAEDLNTMLLVDEIDLAQIEFMLVPFNNHERTQCWLDCVGIHPQTKLRDTYEKSLQLANLMTCSSVLSDCLKGQFYVITTNHITLSRLSLNNSIYAKLQTLVESHLFRPLSLPLMSDPSLSVQEHYKHATAVIVAQYQKRMPSTASPNATSD